MLFMRLLTFVLKIFSALNILEFQISYFTLVTERPLSCIERGFAPVLESNIYNHLQPAIVRKTCRQLTDKLSKFT